MDTLVELEGVNGEWFTLAGAGEGDRGVWLGTDVAGLYEPPVKVVYEEPGNFPGARYLNHRILRRDIVFGVYILNDATSGGDSWLSRDSEWRKAWAYNADCKLHITTAESGHRYLKLRLGTAAPDVSLKFDPNILTLNTAVMTCIAGDPFWYGDDVVYDATTTLDTRFQPTLFDIITSLFSAKPQETLHINVDPSDGRGGLNPTDQYVWPKWQVPGSQELVPTLPFPFPPGVDIPWDTAPYTQWVIPDYSFEDPTMTNRRLTMPGFIIGEDCTIDTDPRVEQVTSASGSPVWARMNGVRFRNAIPPYTKNRDFELTVTGCAPGQMVTLRIQRPWTRPWGLE